MDFDAVLEAARALPADDRARLTKTLEHDLPGAAGVPPKSDRRAAKVAEAAVKQARAKQKQRWAAKRRETRRTIDELRGELAALRGSYYLSGAAKKLDLRAIAGFSDLARTVIAEGRTAMDYDRLYTLWQAVQGAPEGYPIAEVGAYLGGSARFIAETLRQSGRPPRFYVCDTFAGHPRVAPEIDVVHRAAEKFQDTSVERVAAYLGDAANIEIVAGDIVDTSARLAHEPAFGFVHVDVDVYPATRFCLRFFAPRLARGGVMVVDDYGFITCPGAKQAVDEFIAASREFRLFHLLTGQAVLFRGG
jgi:O-methyltransferase